MSNQNQKKMRKLAARAASASMRANQPPAKQTTTKQPPNKQPPATPNLDDLFVFTAEDFERAAHKLRLRPQPINLGPPPAKQRPTTTQRGEFRPLFSCPRTGDPTTLAQRARVTFRDQLFNHPRGYQPRHMLGIWPLRVGGQGLPFIFPVS